MQRERPADTRAGGQQRTTYAGEGGVGVGSFIRKLAYAVKYRELNFFLSDALNDRSRILDHRTPIERVERVSPAQIVPGICLRYGLSHLVSVGVEFFQIVQNVLNRFGDNHFSTFRRRGTPNSCSHAGL